MLKKSWTLGAVSAALLTAVSSGAQAQVMSEMDVYAGLNLAWLNTSLEFTEGPVTIRPDEASIMALYGRLGVFLNPNFSVEGRVGFSLGEDTLQFQQTEAAIDIGTYYGIYARGGLPVSEMFYPYAVIGYTRGEAEISVFGDSRAESASSLSYGIGMDIRFARGFTANMEYITLVDAENVELVGLSFGVGKTF